LKGPLPDLYIKEIDPPTVVEGFAWNWL